MTCVTNLSTKVTIKPPFWLVKDASATCNFSDIETWSVANYFLVVFAYSFLKVINSIFCTKAMAHPPKPALSYEHRERLLAPSCMNKGIQFQTSYFIIMLKRNVRSIHQTTKSFQISCLRAAWALRVRWFSSTAWRARFKRFSSLIR